MTLLYILLIYFAIGLLYGAILVCYRWNAIKGQSVLIDGTMMACFIAWPVVMLTFVWRRNNKGR